MPKGRQYAHVGKLRSGWKPIGIGWEGQYYQGWRLGNWVTWFVPTEGWLWDWRPL